MKAFPAYSLLSLLPFVPLAAAPPSIGSQAPDFTLNSISGKSVTLSQMKGAGPLVLIVLRGYPGYQCPICNRQVQELLRNAQGFTDAGARVVMIYPGPPAETEARAREFLTGKTLPPAFDLLLDPDYNFTRLYDLRWDAPRETAYPSTFLIDTQGKIFFSKVSKTHGGRTSAAEVLDALPKQSSAR